MMSEFIISTFVLNATNQYFEAEMNMDAESFYFIRLLTPINYGRYAELKQGDLTTIGKDECEFTGHEIIDDRRIALLIDALKQKGIPDDKFFIKSYQRADVLIKKYKLKKSKTK